MLEGVKVEASRESDCGRAVCTALSVRVILVTSWVRSDETLDKSLRDRI